MDANVTANCVHPGIVRTRLTRDRDGLITDLVFFLTSKLLKSVPQVSKVKSIFDRFSFINNIFTIIQINVRHHKNSLLIPVNYL